MEENKILGEEQEEIVSGEERLKLISAMIEKTKDERTPSFEYDLKYWGLACFLVGLLTFYMTRETGNQIWGLLWLLVFPIMLPLIMHRRRTQKRVKTYLDDAIDQVFILMILFIIVIIIGVFSYAWSMGQRPLYEYIIPLIVFVVPVCFSQVWSLLKISWASGVCVGVSIVSIRLLFNVIYMESMDKYPAIHFMAGFILAMVLVLPGFKYRRRVHKIK